MMIAKDIIDYMENFYGYGNLNAALWFIGIEESGDVTPPHFLELDTRIDIWKNVFQKKVVVDCKEYHQQINVGTDCFDSNKTIIQDTWKDLISFALSYFKKTTITKEDIINYQHHHLAQEHGNICLLELFPLPKKKSNQFPYHALFNKSNLFTTNLPYCSLTTLKKYHNLVTRTRVKRIADMIKRHKPKLIVFYSNAKEIVTEWKNIAHEADRITSSQWVQNNVAYSANTPNRSYLIIPHTAKSNNGRKLNPTTLSQHAQTSPYDKEMIVLYGKGNTGKTTTIDHLHTLLTTNGFTVKAGTTKTNIGFSNPSDFHCSYTKLGNSTSLILSSRGDKIQEIDRHLVIPYLNSGHKPDIIVCTCRSQNSTSYKHLQKLAVTHGYRINFIDKTIAINHSTANSNDASTLLKMIGSRIP